MTAAFFLLMLGGLATYAGFKNIPFSDLIQGKTEPRESAFHSSGGGGSSGGGKNSPISGGIFTKGNLGRIDEGVDFTGAGPVPAVDSGTIVHVDTHSGWPGGTFIVERLDSGKLVYYAENIAPSVRVGQKVRRGQSIGHARGTFPYVEVGWADANLRNAAAHTHYTEGQATAEGHDFFNRFFSHLGVGGSR
jgi:hypothetical protein